MNQRRPDQNVINKRKDHGLLYNKNYFLWLWAFFFNKNDNFIVQPVLFGCHDYEDSMGENTDLITVT